jgi:hypothetical protein
MAHAFNFCAFFTDGSFLNQGNDVGGLGKGGSAYTDLCLLQERGKVLEAFSLLSDDHEVMVVLTTGAFDIDGEVVLPGGSIPDWCSWRTDEREMPAPGKAGFGGRGLLYYRKVIVEMVTDAKPEITHFCLGYEAGGVRTVLGVSPEG